VLLLLLLLAQWAICCRLRTRAATLAELQRHLEFQLVRVRLWLGLLRWCCRLQHSGT